MKKIIKILVLSIATLLAVLGAGGVMRINRGVFEDSAQIGEHKIETVAGGRTLWQWTPN